MGTQLCEAAVGRGLAASAACRAFWGAAVPGGTRHSLSQGLLA